MKTTEVTPNLIQLTKWGLMNAYLVREDDGFTLVDTTMSAADEILAASVRCVGTIRRIVLTHGHGDHVGSVDALREKLGSEVPVLMPALDAAIHAGAAVQPPARKRGSWPKLATAPGALPASGESIGNLRVIATPGHTPGHVALLDVRDNVVIAGDALSNVGGLSIPYRAHWRFPLPYIGTCDPDATVASAQLIRALEPTVIVFGHGRALRDPLPELDRALATAARRQPTTSAHREPEGPQTSGERSER